METAGTYGSTTGALLTEIGRRITNVTDDPRETLWLEQRISLAVQRGNTFSILSAVRNRYDQVWSQVHLLSWSHLCSF